MMQKLFKKISETKIYSWKKNKTNSFFFQIKKNKQKKTWNTKIKISAKINMIHSILGKKKKKKKSKLFF